MDRLLASIAGFHDSLTKEIHLVNRGYVGRDKRMSMGHRYDAQVLIQSQWEPFAIELLFMGIEELHLGLPGEYWGATGSVEIRADLNEQKRITMAFDSEFRVVCESLVFRARQDWLGNRTFLKFEVPSTDAIPADILQTGWRQCSSCRDAWEEEVSEEYSYCPSCGRLTELRH